MTIVLASFPAHVFILLVFGVIWLGLFIWLALRTLRRGHTVLFIIGFFIPLAWLIGALIEPRNP